MKVSILSDHTKKETNQDKDSAKKLRLAQALRENLKKRKAQSRQRTVSGDSSKDSEEKH